MFVGVSMQHCLNSSVHTAELLDWKQIAKLVSVVPIVKKRRIILEQCRATQCKLSSDLLWLFGFNLLSFVVKHCIL
jgi:hypothetical protein